MKKAAIITLTGNFNYGNKLQNYAIQEIIKRFEFDVYTLWNKSRPYNKLRPLKEAIKLCILLIKDRKNAKRKWNFYRFNRKYIKNYYKTIYTGNDLSFLNNKFDKFIIGSDQIWNYKFNKNYFGNFEFAKFANKEKCISYAASMGVNSIPEEKIETYKKGFEHVSAISVREEKAVDFVKKISGKEAKLVLDPTLLLNREEWEKIIEIPKNQEKNYILTYFLGGMNEKNKIELKKYAEKNKLEIIDIYDQNDSRYYYCNPSEFLYLIKNSSLVLTDSFHACVFSIIFGRPFFVLDREDVGNSMSTRLETLLSRYSLEKRKVDNISNLPKVDSFIDYEKIYKQIDEDRRESIEFLERALK